MPKNPQTRVGTRTSKTTAIVVAVVGLLTATYAQEMAVNLEGTVVDQLSQGIAGAKVGIVGSPLTTTSDAQGHFALNGTLAGIVKRASLPGGFRILMVKGRLTLLNPGGHLVRLEWITADGHLRILAESENGIPDLERKVVDLDQLAGARTGIFWLRVVSKSSVSSFRFLKLAGSHGRLLSEFSDTQSIWVGQGKVANQAAVSLVLEVSAAGFLEKRFAQLEPVKSGLALVLLPHTATLLERSRDFIGAGRTFRLAFLRKESGSSRKFVLNYVDMAEMVKDTMPIHTFADSRGPDNSPYGAFAPSWSPDGRLLAYETGWENLTTPISRIYLQPLQGARMDGPGFPATNPRWWTDGKDTTLVWCTSGNQSGWIDSSGSTLRQKVTVSGPTGPVEMLAKGSYNGGLSPDGRYLATGYPYGVMLDRTEKVKRYFHIYPGHPKAKDGSPTDSLQVCNASVSQDPTHSGRMLFLDFGVPEEPAYANMVTPKIYAQHRMILIGDYASDLPGRIVDFIDTPPSELLQDKTWDDPEWTNLPDFAVATTRDPDGDKSNPSEPQSTQPDIYLIKLSTKETLRVFAGGNQCLPVAWIGP